MKLIPYSYVLQSQNILKVQFVPILNDVVPDVAWSNIQDTSAGRVNGMATLPRSSITQLEDDLCCSCLDFSINHLDISSQCELHRGHQDPAEQGGLDANTSQHEHIHRVEAGGGVQEHIPRGHRSDISGTGATWS